MSVDVIEFGPDEKDLVEVSFAARLDVDAGESIASVAFTVPPEIELATSAGFGTLIPPGTAEIDGVFVRFWLRIAGDTSEGVYDVGVKITTNGGAVREGCVLVSVVRCQ